MIFSPIYLTQQKFTKCNSISKQNIEKTYVQAPLSTGYNEAPHDFQIQPLEIFLVLPALCGDGRDKGEEIEKL